LTDAAEAPAPSLAALFAGFSSVGLSGFGGVLPFARLMLVDRRRWLAPADFNALLGLCQLLPGPNVVNLAVCVGARFHGARGALAAVGGLLAGPLLIVLALAVLYERFGAQPQIQGALRGIAAVGAGLLVATGLRMARALRYQAALLPITAAIFLMLIWLRWPMLPVMLGLLLPAGLVGWALVRREERRGARQ